MKLPTPVRPKFDPYMKCRAKFRNYSPGASCPNTTTIYKNVKMLPVIELSKYACLMRKIRITFLEN